MLFDFVALLHLQDMRCWLIDFLCDYDNEIPSTYKYISSLTVHSFSYIATKLAQAQKFNDPKDPCKVLVATDAIGMGINL